MKNKTRPGAIPPLRIGLMALLGLTLIIAPILFFLSPLEDHDDAGASTHGNDNGARGEALHSTGRNPAMDRNQEAAPSVTRNPILPETDSNPKKTITGFVSLDGSMLGGVTIQAFADVERKIPWTSGERIRSSPLFYSELGEELAKTIDVDALVEQPGEQAPEPVAKDVMGKDGSFRLSVPPCKSLFFHIDHDFYFLPLEQQGPYFLAEGDGPSSLEDFDGTLEAELGAMVRVTVEDHDRLPFEAVTVELMRGSKPALLGVDAGGFAITDDKGVALFRGVPADRPFSVRCAPDGWAPARSEEFIARAGQVHRITLSLHEGSMIEVRVAGPEGEPLSRALVFLEAWDTRSSDRDAERAFPRYAKVKDLLRSSRRNHVDSGTTDAQGRLAFPSPAPGEYRIRASYPGFVEAVTDPPLTLTESWSAPDVELTLGWGQVIEGVVLDDRDSPVVDATMYALPRPASSSDPHGSRSEDPGRAIRLGLMATPESLRKTTNTDSAGAFRITGLEADGSVDVIALADGYTPALAGNITPPTRKLLLVMDRLGSVEGSVIDAIDSTPIDSFTVRIVPAPDEAGGPWIGRERKHGKPRERKYEDGMKALERALQETVDRLTRSDFRHTEREEAFANAGGAFRLPDIIPGRYGLCVSAKGYAPRLSEPFRVDTGGTQRGIVVALGPGATIRGNVYSESGAESGADIRIRVEDRRDGELALLLDTVADPVTDRDGAFALTGVPAGEFVIRASHDAHPPVLSDPFVVTEGRDLEGLVLTFPPGASIKGIAIDDAGQPLKREPVTCRSLSAERPTFRRTRTDNEGSFVFRDLPPETYRISLTRAKRLEPLETARTDDLLLAVEEGDELEVLLRRPPPEGVTISGFVTDDGALVRQGFLAFRQEDRKLPTRNALIEDDGSYRVQGVAPGLVRIDLRLGSNESTSLSFEVPDKREVVHPIELPGGGIRGTVKDGATGLSLRGARITLIPMAKEAGVTNRKKPRGVKKTLFSDSQGAFQFRLIAPGYYHLRAEGPDMEGPGYFDAELFDIAVAEDQTIDGLEVYLYEGGGLHATVTDPQNRPLGNALVIAIEDQKGSETRKRTKRRGRTGRDGTVLLDGLEPGRYRLTFQARRRAGRRLSDVYITRDRYTNVQAVLTRGIPVRVRLYTDPATPIRNAKLSLIDERGIRYAIPKTNGRKSGRNGNIYDLGPLTRGTYTLHVKWKTGGASTKITVSKPGVMPVKIESRTPEKNKRKHKNH